MEMFLKSVRFCCENVVQLRFLMKSVEKSAFEDLATSQISCIFAALENTIGQKKKKISRPMSPFVLQSGYLGESVQEMSNT